MAGKWILKALVQKAISLLPYRHKINHLFQRHVTKGVILDQEYFLNRITHARDHLEIYRKKTGNKYPNKTLELGTGWYPIVPIYFFLAGSDEVFSVDIVDYSNPKSIRKTIEVFVDSFDNGLLKSDKEGLVMQRIDILKEIANSKKVFDGGILKELNIKLVKMNAMNTDFDCNYFDLIHSNNTLEHIPEPIIRVIFNEFGRILSTKGVMSHFIDHSDHFAHFDHSISIYNFLQYSDFQWKIIDNAIQPQNRMRVTDYQKIFNETGFIHQLYCHREGDKKVLESIKLHKKYGAYSMDDIAVSHSHFYAIKITKDIT
jgi:SAM-dependent methyltransferase